MTANDMSGRHKEVSNLLSDCLELNKVPARLGIEVMQEICASVYAANNVSYEDYCSYMNLVRDSYKSYWEKED